VCAREGGANTTSFLAAHFALRNTKNYGGSFGFFETTAVSSVGNGTTSGFLIGSLFSDIIYTFISCIIRVNSLYFVFKCFLFGFWG